MDGPYGRRIHEEVEDAPFHRLGEFPEPDEWIRLGYPPLEQLEKKGEKHRFRHSPQPAFFIELVLLPFSSPETFKADPSHPSPRLRPAPRVLPTTAGQEMGWRGRSGGPHPSMPPAGSAPPLWLVAEGDITHCDSCDNGIVVPIGLRPGFHGPRSRFPRPTVQWVWAAVIYLPLRPSCQDIV